MTQQLGSAAILLFLAVQAIAVAISLYQSAVIVAGSLRPPSRRRKEGPGPLPRLGLMIPARNEELVIGEVVDDLRAQDYPEELVSVLVVAHDCSDETAEVAREHGATVVELTAPGGGKLAAMRKGLEWFGDSVEFAGVFDADVRVDPGVLRAVATLSGSPAAAQLETSSHPQLRGVALGHAVSRQSRALLWWRPRSRLGLSVVFNGGGFFVRPEALLPLMSGLRTMTEDLELTARLVASGGKVAYLEGSWISVEEPAKVGTSIQQRVRWARGHLGVVRWEAPRLLAAALRGRFAALDLTTYLLVPTRMLTRLTLTGLFALAVGTSMPAIPVWVLACALAGEWLLPAVIALKARLVPLHPRALLTVAEVTGLSLLWFPIGLLALVTFRRRSWRQVPRRSNGSAGTAERAN